MANINVLYLDKSEVSSPNVEDSIPIYGTLKIHHVNRVNIDYLEFYYNSRHKKESKLLNSANFSIDMEIVTPSNIVVDSVSDSSLKVTNHGNTLL